MSSMFSDGSLRWVLDSGHGWLRVPLASCEGIAFSEFSYVDPRGGWAYLEEDSDAGMWVRCFDAGGVVIRVESFDGECFVRDLPSFPRVASVTGWAASVA